MSLIGHNGGPSVEPGASWRRQCWRAARAELLPKLPIEVIRLRVKRAQELGLDYRTYAGVRAASGHDIVAFLFSTNALRLLREGQALAPGRAEKLAVTRDTGWLLAAQPPLDPETTRAGLGAQGVAFQAAIRAPGAQQSWGEVRGRLRDLLARTRHPAGGVLVIGDSALEREWAEAGRMAGYLPAHRYFPEAGAGA